MSTKPLNTLDLGRIQFMLFDDSQPEFANLDPAQSHLSEDEAWMQRLVLVAKHTVVWLAQLSLRYERQITRLDDIPDEALQELAHRGFNGLWLVGLWQRSPASRKIKHLTGHPRAVASAYSISEYEIAQHLGGDEALRTFRRKAAKSGIRLAADMVPNHTGMDAPWMIQHPDYYLSTKDSPIDQYRFGGANLSETDEIELYLEDHYLDRTDAAVVFKRVETSTGDVSYIYHGNDGVDTPWNDTAQLNFLRADVRKAVIAQILDIARRFPILRFDAAMTLTRQHFRRLWFPQQGDQGNVETRKKHGLSQNDFDELFSQEFWREVVEKVHKEIPGTLLLAESYWLTENFFAHALGMHRVYNAAFMHSLAKEDNAQFRLGLKKVLHFNPALLARYVNYMSTPDEQSALSQFGKGDKYFGVSTLLATLPGLPLFAHGQVEGLEERYAMDFAQPRLDESPDVQMIGRHHQQIVPLLQQRALFASAENFQLFDVLDADGDPLEDIIAFSNRAEDMRALVLYNNSPTALVGNISPQLVEVLELSSAQSWRTEELHSATELEWETAILRKEGLPVSLAAYQSQVFWNFEAIS
jgi:glycosidase